ncbi:MAG: BatD family protein [Acidobacteriota bacterium]
MSKLVRTRKKTTAQRDVSPLTTLTRWVDETQRRGWGVVIWLLLWTAQAYAQEVTITAEVEPNPVGLDDQVRLTVTVQGTGGGAERPVLPPISGLKLVGGPSVSNQFQWINGQSSSSQSFTYLFLPEKEGTVRIPAIGLSVGGKTYRSQEISLKVVSGSVGTGSSGRRRRGPSSIFDDLGFDDDSPFRDRSPRRGDLLTVAETDRTTVFVGEQITLSYKILTQVPVTQVEIREAPSLKGFWVEEIELPKDPPSGTRALNGKEYIEYVIKKQALFANASGNLSIPPATFGLVVRTSSGGFFSLGTQQSVLRKTEPLTIKVNPLPEAGKPADFSGAVGDFRLEASTDKNQAESGEAVNLKVSLVGTGNLKTITEFPLPELPGFKIYSAKSSDTMALRGDVFQGSKTWEYVIVPIVPGKERIPELAFSYFSPKERRYREARAPAMEIAVLKGKDTPQGGTAIAGFVQQGIVKRGTDIHFIQVGATPLRNRSGRLYQSGWLYAGFLLPLCFNAGLLIYVQNRTRSQQDVIGFRSRQASRVAGKRLAEARKCLHTGDLTRFHGILESSVTGYLSDKFNLPQIDITSQGIRRFVEQRCLNSDLGAELAGLLEECHFARYAPVQQDRDVLQALFERARNTIIRIEKQV